MEGAQVPMDRNMICIYLIHVETCIANYIGAFGDDGNCLCARAALSL